MRGACERERERFARAATVRIEWGDFLFWSGGVFAGVDGWMGEEDSLGEGAGYVSGV